MMSDLVSKQDTINADLIDRKKAVATADRMYEICDGDINDYHDLMVEALEVLSPAEPETAKRIIGCSRNGMTMWYQCNMCHEPVDEKDAFCRGCGRRFEDE